MNELTNLSNTLKKLRKVSGLNQKEACEILGVDQTRLSKIETGKQKLEVTQLISISNFFGESIDNLVNNRINYFKVAEKFNQPIPLPEKYMNHRGTKMGDILPLIYFIDDKKGFEFRESLLRDLGLEGFLILEPSIEIGYEFKLDLLRAMFNQKILTRSSIKSLLPYTRAPEIHHQMHELFLFQENPLDLIKDYILNIRLYENNFDYSFKESTKSNALIKVKPQRHLKGIDFEDKVLKNTLCELRSGAIKELPLYSGLEEVELLHKECHFHGDKQCVYEISHHG